MLLLCVSAELGIKHMLIVCALVSGVIGMDAELTDRNNVKKHLFDPSSKYNENKQTLNLGKILLFASCTFGLARYTEP